MNMIAHGVMALARFPDQRRRLRDEPALWNNALEELLRYVSPVQGLARTTTRDVELHGVTIPEGDQVLVLYGSANHDPDAFPDPDVLDFDRAVKVHWTFGHGIHYCLGNAVARLEVRVALQALSIRSATGSSTRAGSSSTSWSRRAAWPRHRSHCRHDPLFVGLDVARTPGSSPAALSRSSSSRRQR